MLEWVDMPAPGDLPDPGIEPVSPVSPALQEDLYPLSHLGSPLLSFNSFQILLFLGFLPWSEDGGRTKHRYVVTPQGDETAVSS